jgi:ACS family tartrate transporter-like MFS transporter
MSTPSVSVLGNQTLKRVTTRLIPLLLICYAIAFIDRTNISIASLTMNADIGLSDAAFGLGAGIFFVGYTIFEIPSNIILARVGARMWIARIMVSWGIVTILMMFVHNEWTFYAGRLLLGICEAGFYPGVIYFLTLWFPAAARGRAFSLFQIGGPIALVVGSPLAGSLLNLDGLAGLAGWQWVFLVTGIPAIVFGAIVFFYLTDKPADADWLEPAQRTWLTTTMDAEHAGDHGGHVLKGALRTPLVWIVSGINFFTILSLYGVSLWLPRIVKALTGQTNFITSVITAIPYVFAVVAVILVARSSDRRKERYFHVMIPCFAGAVGLVASGLIGGAPILSLAALSLASAGIYSAIPPMWGMTTGVISGPVAAAAIGVISCIGNMGGFFGPYVAGLINEFTGNTVSSLLAMALSLFIAGLLVLVARRSIRRGAVDNHSEIRPVLKEAL